MPGDGSNCIRQGDVVGGVEGLVPELPPSIVTVIWYVEVRTSNGLEDTPKNLNL